ncbi:MAG: response regulator [Candidatus Hydrogenedentes bacterium]|nr:response regulator [Candidatus Hydrogenedentota bacterium]
MSRILVIDDEPVLRITLRYLLEQEGHQVWDAENGRVGVDICRNEHPDLVITDIVMPEQEGVTTFEILREEFPEMPVIAMSGAQAPTTIRTAAESGKLAYVMKPVDTSSLFKLIQSVLKKSPAPVPRRTAPGKSVG